MTLATRGRKKGKEDEGMPDIFSLFLPRDRLKVEGRGRKKMNWCVFFIFSLLVCDRKMKGGGRKTN